MIVALGKTALTMRIIESEKSIVTSVTASLCCSGSFCNRAMTSDDFVPLTMATIVPDLPCPSLLESMVNRSSCYLFPADSNNLSNDLMIGDVNLCPSPIFANFAH